MQPFFKNILAISKRVKCTPTLWPGTFILQCLMFAPFTTKCEFFPVYLKFFFSSLVFRSLAIIYPGLYPGYIISISCLGFPELLESASWHINKFLSTLGHYPFKYWLWPILSSPSRTPFTHMWNVLTVSYVSLALCFVFPFLFLFLIQLGTFPIGLFLRLSILTSVSCLLIIQWVHNASPIYIF